MKGYGKSRMTFKNLFWKVGVSHAWAVGVAGQTVNNPPLKRDRWQGAIDFDIQLHVFAFQRRILRLNESATKAEVDEATASGSG